MNTSSLPSDHDMTRGEVTAFTFGYLNAIAEIIRQTIASAEKKSHNERAGIETRKLGADYMNDLHDRVGTALGIPSKAFDRFMNRDIVDVMGIIGKEAYKSTKILDDEIDKVMEESHKYKHNQSQSNWREENR